MEPLTPEERELLYRIALVLRHGRHRSGTLILRLLASTGGPTEEV